MSTVLDHPTVSHLLDGRRFDGVILECGKNAGDADTITFRDGRFHSTACGRYGYGDGAYVAHQAADRIEFSAETQSPIYGLLRWRGAVSGKRMDATLTMVRDGAACGEKWLLAGQV